ncbi:MAG: phage tail sheath C-terminal domain-containing protein [Nitrospirales bacterium]
MTQIFRTPGVYIQEIRSADRTIAGVPTSTALLMGTFPKGPQYVATQIRSLRQFAGTFGDLRNNHLSSLVTKQFFENGGKEIWILSTDVRSSGTATPFLKGLSLVSHLPSFNILLIPETTRLPDLETTKVFHAAVSFVEKQRAMYILDPPTKDASGQTVKDLAAWVRSQAGIHHPNVILYFPPLQVRSRLASSRTVTIPSSGTMAGLFARLDRTRGVWKAPAGTEASLQNVVGLEQSLTSQDINLLASANINALKQISSSGYVAWGARTLSTDPEWKYVPVRRLTLFVESSIEKGIQWAVFEPNDEPLWAQIRQSISNFLEAQYRQGAFQGMKPEHAYFVKCGRDTTTPTDQTTGIVNIMVGFAPLKPAEFVILNIKQTAKPLR